MKEIVGNKRIQILIALAAVVLTGALILTGIHASKAAREDGKQPAEQTAGGGGSGYSLEQAMSDNAQLSTIAFSGLAFITGSLGADTFMPPGKVADFFGFQYMRDVDVAGYGHNTQFLSRVADNMLYILSDAQKQKLIDLATAQTPEYIEFAYNRYPMMAAFRRQLEGAWPTGSEGLSVEAVGAYASRLYQTDAELSTHRALVLGEIVQSFTTDQKAYLEAMAFDDFNTWPEVSASESLKKGMDNETFVLVMTYASELFSWYKGGVDADIYFCPERHGTYFGGFYLKDYPAMNNPEYFISTTLTGDKGKAFLEILDDDQRALIEGIVEEQKSAMSEIGEIRTKVATELRKAMTDETVDEDLIMDLMERYGQLDGELSALYALRFSEVKESLTQDQMAAMVKLRDLDVAPQGGYYFSTPVAMPEIPDTDFLFGVGTMDAEAGHDTPPAGWTDSGNIRK